MSKYVMEKQKRNRSGIVHVQKEEMKAVSSRLRWEAFLPPRAMVMPRPGCCGGPSLGLWLHSSQGLCWCPWLMLL